MTCETPGMAANSSGARWDGGAGVLVGRGGYCASVENHDFRVNCGDGAFKALILKLAFDRGAVGLGGAAPKILYVKTRHHTIVAAHLGIRGHLERIAQSRC